VAATIEYPISNIQFQCPRKDSIVFSVGYWIFLAAILDIQIGPTPFLRFWGCQEIGSNKAVVVKAQHLASVINAAFTNKFDN